MKEARREKIRNKTRERERERHGEVFKAVLERQAKGPPAHVLARMSPEQRRLDKVVRSVSEVGYVAMVKKKLGFRLKDDEMWRVLEEGEENRRQELDAMEEQIAKENEKRREVVGQFQCSFLLPNLRSWSRCTADRSLWS